MSEKPEWLPSDEEIEKERAELATSLLVMQARFQPIFDAADGMKADMERRGWSPTAAESVALQWLMHAMTMSMHGIGR